MNEIKLCPCNSSGCPSIKLEEGKVIIIDDYGNSVTMEINEAELIADALKNLDE
jgi:hypothetical protein